MRPFRALVWKELITLARDRHALLLLFAMPTLFILLMSLALRDRFAADGDAPFSYYLVNHDSTAALSDTLVAAIRSHPSFRNLGRGPGEDADAAEVRAGRAQFLVLVPDGFAAALTAARPLTIAVRVSPSVDQRSAGLFGAAVRESLSRVYVMQRLREVVGRFGAFIPGGVPSVAVAPGAMERLIDERSLSTAGDRGRLPNSVQQNVPAWLVFAMFFVALPLSTTWLQERRQGTYTRLRSIGLAPASLLLAKFAPYFVINMVQVALMLAVGVYLVPLFGGDALTLGHSGAGLLIMALAVSFAAVSYGLLIANIVSTVEQATILTGVSNLLLAAIGGVMVPRFIMPAAMQTLASASPMSWGLEGFLNIFLRDGRVADVLPNAALLLGFGVASLLLSGAAMRGTRGR